jgi:hypothetical protein
MNAFSYHSEQIHAASNNGEGGTRRDIVHIDGGKGMKAVEIYDMGGNLLSRADMPLTKAELDCIERHKFIPGLFKDCIKAIDIANSASLRRVTKKRGRGHKGRSKGSRRR